MADQLKLRGGSEDASKNFTGGAREVTVDTTEWTLRVHDGVTPGGHKLLKSGSCLVVEEADKCDPNKPDCKVTVNGDLHVGGDVTIDGTIDLGDVVIDLETDDVTLKNPGDYVADCNVPDGNGLKTQADANKWFYQGIVVLDRELCKVQTEVNALEYQIQKLENRVDQLEIDVAELKKEVENLKQEIIDIENAIKLLELEIEKNQQNIEQNAIDIAKLQKDVEYIFNQLQDIEDWIKAHSLDDHIDVDLGAPSDGDLFVYKNGKWTNESKCFYECHSYIQNLATL